MEFTPSPSSIFQNKKIKYNNRKPTKNGIIWINFSKIHKARCTLTPLSLRSARLTQYMRFARCTSLSHILLRFTTQNIAYTEPLRPHYRLQNWWIWCYGTKNWICKKAWLNKFNWFFSCWKPEMLAKIYKWNALFWYLECLKRY